MAKKANDCSITIYGVSVGTFKEGKIICEYGSSVDIEQALIGSPVANISIGASIDKEKRQLTIYMSNTGNVNIDSASMGILQFPLNEVPDNSTFKIIKATFKNNQGETVEAVILPATSVVNWRVKNKSEMKVNHIYFMLNGRSIGLETLSRLEKRAYSNCIPIRILKK